MSWACTLLLIVLLLTSLSVLIYNRRQVGNMHASILIGNATRRTMNNLSLQQDLDAVMDNSGKLIGVQGFVRDAKKNNTFELSSCNDTFKDEEINGLWSILCPEKGEELLNVSRTEWGGKENVASQRRSQTADLLIVDGHSYTANSDNYYEKMRDIGYLETKNYGDLKCNFWIADDGKVFEGMGWNRYNYIFNGGLGPRSLIIVFIKKDKDAEPSAEAIKTFKKLVKSAICRKTLSIHYRLIPYYLINDPHFLGNDSFERKEMKSWHSYVENLDFLVPCERVEIIDPQIVPKEKWRNIKPKGEFMTLSSPFEYIMISQRKARCFFNCTNYLNVLEREYGIPMTMCEFNFLLSEEGRVYEVMGWEETCIKFYRTKKILGVGFLGYFNSYGPSKSMFLALNTLIQDGLRSGKLSKDYNIVTMNTMEQRTSHFLGYSLENEIRKLDRYSEKYLV